MDNLKKHFEKELREFDERAPRMSGKFSIQELDRIQKLTSIVKNINKNEMYDQYEGEHSRESYGRDASYDDGDSYYSERRGRDHMGRYTSREGYSGADVGRNGYSMKYSRDEGKQKMIEELEHKMRNASPKEKETIEMCLEFLKECN